MRSMCYWVLLATLGAMLYCFMQWHVSSASAYFKTVRASYFYNDNPQNDKTESLSSFIFRWSTGDTLTYLMLTIQIGKLSWHLHRIFHFQILRYKAHYIKNAFGNILFLFLPINPLCPTDPINCQWSWPASVRVIYCLPGEEKASPRYFLDISIIKENISEHIISVKWMVFIYHL